MNRQQSKLRFVLDMREEELLAPLALHLDRPTLDEALVATSKESEHQALRVGRPDLAALSREHRNTMRKSMIPIIRHLLGLALYLCAEAPDLRPSTGLVRSPGRPRAKRTKKGERLFPPPSPTVWETGFDLGRRIREAREPGERGGTVRGHVRRAHWHSFWRGPWDSVSRELVVRWLPPIPVKLEDGVQGATVQRVE